MQTNVREWVTEMGERFRNNPTRAPLYVLYTWYLVLWYAVTSRRPIGTNVYERDWDVLLILDACRTDTLREVAPEYDFVETVDTMWSVGSQSDEWMANTFTAKYRDQIGRTRYISGNGHTGQLFERREFPPKNNTTPMDFTQWQVVDLHAFDGIEMVWKNYHDDTYNVALPSVVTDHAIETSRNDDPERLMVHYMQPHLPYLGQAIREGRPLTNLEREGYEHLETGDADRAEVYEMYKDTLRTVLDEVEVLLENIDAERVAITSDHGEAFGEGGAYGHPEGFPHPIVKQVPWVETSASDKGTREPDLERESGERVELEQHLHDLGYK